MSSGAGTVSMPGQPDHDGSGQSEDDHDPVGDEHRSHPARIRHTKREPSRQKPRRRRCCLRRPRNAQPRCALSEPPYGPDHRPPGGKRLRPRPHVRNDAPDGRRARGARAPPADLAAENLRGAIAAGRRVVCSSDGLGDLRRPHRPPRRSTRSRRCRHPAVHCLRDAKR